MAKRHLTPAEIDQIAQRVHLGPQRRAALATTRVPADAPTAKLVDVLVDIERTLTALGRHLGPPRVSEIRRHGGGGLSTGGPMSLPGETIADGAAPRCEDCNKMPNLAVYESGAGFYIGTYCHCGPYTRESGYYPTREEAWAVLDRGAYGR